MSSFFPLALIATAVLVTGGPAFAAHTGHGHRDVKESGRQERGAGASTGPAAIEAVLRTMPEPVNKALLAASLLALGVSSTRRRR